MSACTCHHCVMPAPAPPRTRAAAIQRHELYQAQLAEENRMLGHRPTRRCEYDGESCAVKVCVARGRCWLDASVAQQGGWK